MLMTYIYKFYLYIITINNIFIAILLCVSLLFLYKILRIKILCKDLYLYNKFVTYFSVILYIIFFICLLLLLRWLNYDTVIDLKHIYNNLQQFLQEKSFGECLISVLFMINVIAFWLILFKKMRSILTIQLLKFHLYNYYYAVYDNMLNNMYSLGLEHIGPFTVKEKEEKKFKVFTHFLYAKVLDKFLAKCYILPTLAIEVGLGKLSSILAKFVYFEKFSNFIFYLARNVLVSIRNLLFYSLILLIVYDCIFNNWIITKIYALLPFYIIFMLYYKLGYFLYNTDHVKNEIIFERCYCFPYIAYFNISKEEDDYKDPI